MDLGVRAAGFRVLAQLEWDPNCCATLRAAKKRERSKTVVLEGDVRSVDPKQLRERLHLASGGLDLLFGGPPCQSFSLIGAQRGLEDSRGLLLFEIPRFAREFRPRAIVMEQVKGLLSARPPGGQRGDVLRMLVAELAELGYRVQHRVLLAADFGVPQLRERVFIVGLRDDREFSWPQPTHAPKQESTLFGSMQPYVTAGDVLSGLGQPSGRDAPLREDGHVDVSQPRDRERIAPVPEGSHLAAQRHLPVSIRGRLTPKDTTKFVRVHRGRPANTLRCGEIFFHYSEDRYLTPREYMRLHGYPDDYYLVGPIRGRCGAVSELDQHRQVANSVPPPLARAVAEAVAVALRPGRPKAQGATGNRVAAHRTRRLT